ncbi:MAG: hypothetical protein AAF488_00370 [Planctomycetota bacterium]
MTAPRPVPFNGIYHDIRRTFDGTFHLRPDPACNQTVRFLLAHNATQHRIRLYAHSSLSNHQHTNFGDPEARHPEFRQDLYSQETRTLNRLRKTKGPKWTPDDQCTILLGDPEAVLDSIAYTIANPVHHNLVETPEEWPGFLSLVEDLCAPPRLIRRPAILDEYESTFPKEVYLEFQKPLLFHDWSDTEYRDEIRRRVDEKCEHAASERKRPVAGRIAVLSSDPTDRPSTPPKSNRDTPRVAAKNVGVRRLLRLWIVLFVDEHREARQRFEGHEWTVEFPANTYWHRRRYGVNCRTADPPGGLDLAPISA